MSDQLNIYSYSWLAMLPLATKIKSRAESAAIHSQLHSARSAKIPSPVQAPRSMDQAWASLALSPKHQPGQLTVCI